MKAILRTYLNEIDFEDEPVNVDNEDAFDNPYGDAVPFAVGSNQTILSLEDAGWEAERFRLLSDAHEFYYDKQKEGYSVMLRHHLGIADPYRMVYYKK